MVSSPLCLLQHIFMFRPIMIIIDSSLSIIVMTMFNIIEDTRTIFSREIATTDIRATATTTEVAVSTATTDEAGDLNNNLSSSLLV